MSIAKWFLKNGPGSPGSTAKSFAKQYNKIPKSDHDREWDGLFLSLCKQRLKVTSLLGNSGGSLYQNVDVEDVINFTQGCFAMFVFEMMYLETRQFRDNIIANNDNFFLTTEIIHETIIDNCPTAIKYKLSEFRHRAIKFMNIINE